MNMPGYAAEASLYRTNSHYAVARGGGFLSNGNATLVPQGCGVFQGIFCGSIIAAGGAACAALCLYGPAPCAGCWITFLGGLYGSCKDCIPGWMKDLIDIFESGGSGGGGGSGPPRCCPVGTTCRCGGQCVTVNGQLRCVDGVCLRPNQECP